MQDMMQLMDAGKMTQELSMQQSEAASDELEKGEVPQNDPHQQQRGG